MENSSGRYRAAAKSAVDPGTEALPPARVARDPAQFLARLLVRGAPGGGHLGDDERAGEGAGEPGGQVQRRLGAGDLGEVRQPLRDRRRVVVDDVVDAWVAAFD